ncbi:MAG: hypothetical protein AAGF23_09375 [Acidobacteriota bacterium]
MRILLFLLLFSLPAAFPAGAAPIAGADEHAVFLSENTTDLPFNQLTANDTHAGGSLSIVRDPLYGDLQPDGFGGFTYEPYDDFWSLEIDSFVYLLSDAAGDAEALVTLYAGRPEITAVHMDEDFEDGTFLTNTDYTITLDGNSDLVQSPNAQLEGFFGAEFYSDGDNALLSAGVGSGSHGTGGQGSGGATGTVGCLVPPPSQGGLSADTMLLAVAGVPSDIEGTSQLQVVTTANNKVRLLAHTAQGGVFRSAELLLPGDRVFFELEWTPSTGSSSNAHNLLLRIDGRAVRLRDVPGLSLGSPAFHFGLAPTAAQTSFDPVHLAFDNIKLYSTEGTGVQPSMLRSVEDFEGSSSQFGGAIQTVGQGLQVVHTAASSGEMGLEASASSPGYQVRSGAALTPSLTTSLRVDFSEYLTTWGDLATFYAFGHAPAATNTDTVMRLRIYGGQGNEPRLIATFANATTAGSTWSTSKALPPGPTTIQVQFRAATSAQHANGYLRIWKDAEVFFELDDLDAIGSEADWNHIGLYAADPGTSGYLSMDELIIAGR